MEIDDVGVDDVDAITEQVQQMRQGAGSPPVEPTRPSSPYTAAEAEIVQAADATVTAARGEFPPASEFELVPEAYWKDAVDCETDAAGPKPEQGADAALPGLPASIMSVTAAPTVADGSEPVRADVALADTQPSAERISTASGSRRGEV